MSGDAGADASGPDSRGASVVAAAVTTTAISFIFLVLRFISRAKIVNDLGWSDWMATLGWVFSLANTVCVCLQVKLAGLGTPSEDLDPNIDGVLGTKLVYFTLLVYILGLISVKLSILLLYLRIFRAANVHHMCYAVMAFVIVAGAETFFTSVFSCVPVEAFWDRASHPDAWCFPVIIKSWVDIGIHLTGEAAILLTPIPFTYRLTMPRKQKVAVYLLFSLGTFVIIVGLIRIQPLVVLMNTDDPLYDSALLTIWSSIEINTAVVCSCAMTLRPLLLRYLPRLAGSGYLQNSDNSGGVNNNEASPYPPTVGSRRDRKIRDPHADLLDEEEQIEMHPRGTDSQTALSPGNPSHWSDSSQTHRSDEPLAGPSSQRDGTRRAETHMESIGTNHETGAFWTWERGDGKT